jgi:hypothetical protein
LSAGENTSGALLVLKDAGDEVVGDANVKCAIAFAGEDIEMTLWHV